jgi:transcriptional regulator with PAS, ATPase and Fis domain
MTDHSWIKEFPAAITVCDSEGIIIAMNDASLEVFEEDGGEKVIGTNVLDCHPESARSKLERMMATQQANVYTIEKNGVRKLVYQTPWYENGQYAGFVEMILPIPDEMPHFVRG